MESTIESIFSDRINDIPRSFIREILKVALDHSVISFAGGLPNHEIFPVKELKAAAAKVFDIYGNDVLQYSPSEGLPELREFISRRYKAKMGIDIPIEDILITNGSQQGLDLVGKCLLNKGESIIIEEPSYLAAIQVFSLFEPKFLTVPVDDEGMDIERLKQVVSSVKSKLLYVVPTFQNPSGISYSEANRAAVADIINGTDTLIIDDDPYSELRYSGSPRTSFKKLAPDNTILLGTFSKIIVPGFRLGWIVAPPALMEKLIIAKQASDLNTGNFVQCVAYQYLKDNNIDEHIKVIRERYGRQLKTMMEAIKKEFPKEVDHTHPEGGMFLWASLPGDISTRKLVDIAAKDKVIFVPGDPFYIGRSETNTMRLSFTCVDDANIRLGIQRLGKAIKTLL
jgi:2-aminoadipate transaminase